MKFKIIIYQHLSYKVTSDVSYAQNSYMRFFLVASIVFEALGYGQSTYGRRGVKPWGNRVGLGFAGRVGGCLYARFPFPILPPSAEEPPEHGLLLVDTFSPSHGQYLSHLALNSYGVGVVHVLSPYICGYLEESVRCECSGDELESRLVDLRGRTVALEDTDDFVKQLPFEVTGVVCESDSGLAYAEQLTEAMGLYPERADGFNEARRDKYLMNKAVSEKNIATVSQGVFSEVGKALQWARDRGCMSLEDEGYVWSNGEESEKIVVKPRRGVASDNVHVCNNIEEVALAFDNVLGSAVFGDAGVHEDVLLQTYAKGTEFAVDVVSRNGEHKVAAIWRYEKGRGDSHHCVYYKTELVDSSNEEYVVIDSITQYVREALDALDVHWGMSHTEVKVSTRRGVKRAVKKEDVVVRLIEVNCRQHNTDFAPLTEACIGYNKLDMCLSAYFCERTENSSTSVDEETTEEDEEKACSDQMTEREDSKLFWDNIPHNPTLRTRGMIQHLVCFVKGTVAEVRHLSKISALPSVVAHEVYPEFNVGCKVDVTMDIRSEPGWVHLINEDPEILQADYEQICELMPSMFIVE